VRRLAHLLRAALPPALFALASVPLPSRSSFQQFPKIVLIPILTD